MGVESTDIEVEALKARVAANVNRLRKEKGLSVRKLALLAELEHHQILAVEKAGVDSRMSTLRKISHGLGVDIAVLFDVQTGD